MTEELTRQLAVEKERANYAWRNTRTIEAARQEEMRRRDKLESELHTLRILAQASLDARDEEARTAMALENAQANFHRFDAEERAHKKAMIEASEADRALREALATPNAPHEGPAACGRSRLSAGFGVNTAAMTLAKAGVYAGAHGLEGLANAVEFWDKQPYGTRLYYGPGLCDYLQIGVLKTAVRLLAEMTPNVELTGVPPTDATKGD